MSNKIRQSCNGDCLLVATVHILSKNVLTNIEQAISADIIADFTNLFGSCVRIDDAWVHYDDELILSKHSSASVLIVLIRDADFGSDIDWILSKQT